MGIRSGVEASIGHPTGEPFMSKKQTTFNRLEIEIKNNFEIKKRNCFDCEKVLHCTYFFKDDFCPALKNKAKKAEIKLCR